MRCFSELIGEASKYLTRESFELSPDTFARDFAPWRNVMAANGMKQDGAPIAKRKKENGWLNKQLTGWYSRMAERAKVEQPQKTDPARQLILPASAIADEDQRYFDKAQRGGVVFMSD